MLKQALVALFHARYRLSYRRLLAFLVATFLLTRGLIDQEIWLYVTLAYLGLEVLLSPAAGQPKTKDPS